MKTKGIIAIDIDGTLTAVRDSLSQDVVDYLKGVHSDGWKLLFVTGRTLDWSTTLLDTLPFSFYLSVFNGAYTVEYPEKNVIKKCFLSFEKVFQTVNMVQDEDVGIAFYGPPDKLNKSFLFRKYASHVLVNHLFARAKALSDAWTEVENVMDLPIDTFASMRLFCLPHTAKKIARRIEETSKLHAPMMKDSYDDCFSIVQVTHGNVSKGKALQAVLDHLKPISRIIACGDDHNDISMLELADVAVVMASAPADVLAHADIIAPSARDNGIIMGITNAMKLFEPRVS